ncbi:DUF4145 domain-containing protein [Glutamicibacter soli]
MSRYSGLVTVRCYVEQWNHAGIGQDLRLREKKSRRLVRVLTDDPEIGSLAPLANLLAESYSHSGGLADPQDTNECIQIAGNVLMVTHDEVGFWLDNDFTARVNIAAPEHSTLTAVWCFIEEYGDDEPRNVRLREKITGRKVEMWGSEKESLIAFLSSPRALGAKQLLPNLFEKNGFGAYVLVSGGTTVDTHDSIRFEGDDSLTYLIGPTPDTAYRDALRVPSEDHSTSAHVRTAKKHLYEGHYRAAIISARLAVESACGGGGGSIKKRLAAAPSNVHAAAKVVQEMRNIAVHESDSRIEQQEAEQALAAMKVVLEYLGISRRS